MKQKSIRILTYIFASIFGLISVPPVFSQGIDDVTRLSREDYLGTARSLGMGNAMVAIGGDLGAITQNPAASGIFHTSEVVITPGFAWSTSSTHYNGDPTQTGDTRTRFILSNIGWTGGFETGREKGFVGMNFAVVGNQTGSYVSRVSASGTEALSSWLGSQAFHSTGIDYHDMKFDCQPDANWKKVLAYKSYMTDTLPGCTNEYAAATENLTKDGRIVLGGPLRQKFFKETRGYTYDIDLNASVNISDKLFVGMNLVFQSILFEQSETFEETADHPENFQLGFQTMRYYHARITRGFGFKLQAGLIYRPVAGLSIGASISTPTWKIMTDSWVRDMRASMRARSESCWAESPQGKWKYKLTTPFRWNVGVGYTFGKVAVISADYTMVNYKEASVKSANKYSSDYSILNENIDTCLKLSHIVKVGGEVRIGKIFSLRLGYNYISASTSNADELEKDYTISNTEKDYTGRKDILSAGFRIIPWDMFYIDFAYSQQVQRNTVQYSTYDAYTADGTPLVIERTRPFHILISFGWRF